MNSDNHADRKGDRESASKRYDVGGFSTWDFIIAKGLNYPEGNVIKYIVRHREKHGIEDLLKARTYLDKLIRVEREIKAANVWRYALTEKSKLIVGLTPEEGGLTYVPEPDPTPDEWDPTQPCSCGRTFKPDPTEEPRFEAGPVEPAPEHSYRGEPVRCPIVDQAIKQFTFPSAANPAPDPTVPVSLRERIITAVKLADLGAAGVGIRVAGSPRPVVGFTETPPSRKDHMAHECHFYHRLGESCDLHGPRTPR